MKFYPALGPLCRRVNGGPACRLSVFRCQPAELGMTPRLPWRHLRCPGANTMPYPLLLGVLLTVIPGEAVQGVARFGLLAATRVNTELSDEVVRERCMHKITSSSVASCYKAEEKLRPQWKFTFP